MTNKEVKTILQVSKAIASIRDRDELFTFIINEIQPIFQFDRSLNLFVIDKKKESYSFFFRSLNEGEQEAPEYLERRFPLNDPVFQQMLNSEGAQLMDRDETLSKFPEQWGVNMMKELGLKQAMTVPLIVGGEPIGCLTIHSFDKDRFEPSQFELFEVIADQIAPVVSNILRTEEILKEKELKEELLSISEDITTIRNRDELKNFLHERLRKPLQFDDTFIVLIGEDGQTRRNFLVLSDTRAKQHPYFSQVTHASHPVEGTPFAYVMEQKDPFVFNVDEMLEMFPDYPGLLLMKETGISSGISVRIQTKGVVRGLLVFLFSEETIRVQPKGSLLAGISDQISLCLDNILANEKLFRKDWEKATLLDISESVAAARETKDLFQIIFDKLEPIYEFSDITTLISYDREDAFRVLFTTKDGVIIDGAVEGVPEVMPIQGTPFIEVLDKEAPYIVDMEDFLIRYPDDVSLLKAKELGIVQGLNVPLRFQGKVVASLHLQYYEEISISKGLMQLLADVADRLAVTVMNILAAREIADRQSEKETLLHFSEVMTTVRNRSDLIEVLNNEVKPYVKFEDVAIIMINAARKTRQHLVSQSDEKRVKHPFYQTVTGELPIENSPLEMVLEKGDFFGFETDEMIASYPNHPGPRLMKDTGIEYAFCIQMKLYEEVLGVIVFHFNKKEDYAEERTSLYKGIADQISLTVSNIKANETLQMAQEKTHLLLQITEAIAHINDRASLGVSIENKLGPILGFDDVLILTRDGESKLQVFFFGVPENVKRWKEYQENINRGIQIQNNTYELIYHEGHFEPFIFDLTSELYEQKAIHWEKQLSKKIGYKQSISAPLTYDEEVIGNIEFFSKTSGRFSEDILPLIENATQQIAVAVSNIMANEDIIDRQLEKELQVELGNAITSREEWHERFYGMAEYLVKSFPVDYISFSIDSKDESIRGCAFERIGFDEFRKVDPVHFFQKSGMTAEKYLEVRSKNQYFNLEVFNGQDFQQLINEDHIKRSIANLYRVKSNLNVPLLLSKEGQFQISLYSRSANIYNERHLSLMNRIIPAMIHPLEKMMAFEQIENLNEQLKHEKTYLMEEMKTNLDFEEIIGQSVAMENVFHQVKEVASLDTTVLIMGETGTGKELIARAVHDASDRKGKILIKVNCAALPSELMESELFGHEKGAFTGAIKQRIGKFELADQGTIFLDEIGELSLELQAKLLRVLQEREIERLGGSELIRVDFRVIAATNRNLEDEVRKGKFRADLFYRLHIFPIKVPPLRERGEDVMILALHFAHRYAQKIGVEFKGFTKRTEDEFRKYAWPGNVREMQNMIEQALISQRNKSIELLPTQKGMGDIHHLVVDDRSYSDIQIDHITIEEIKKRQEQLERDSILKVLQNTKWKVRGREGAASKLGLNPTTLEYRMKKLGIDR